MKNNNYVLFYKKNENNRWQSKRPDLPVEQWEDYAKTQGYSEYSIKDLSTYDADDLHLLTSIVLFNGKYYLPEEEIPYPDNTPTPVDEFEISMEWEDEKEFYDVDYDEVYRGEELWTDINTIFSPDKKNELGIVAQLLVKYLPEFLEKLESNKHAVYINDEYSPFKWLAWIRDNKIRLIHQDYGDYDVETVFDILVDKNCFYDACHYMIKTMQKYADADQKRYEQYLKNKYGKKDK